MISSVAAKNAPVLANNQVTKSTEPVGPRQPNPALGAKPQEPPKTEFGPAVVADISTKALESSRAEKTQKTSMAQAQTQNPLPATPEPPNRTGGTQALEQGQRASLFSRLA